MTPAANADILQGFILGSTIFLLFINNLPVDVIFNIANGCWLCNFAAFPIQR